MCIYVFAPTVAAALGGMSLRAAVRRTSLQGRSGAEGILELGRRAGSASTFMQEPILPLAPARPILYRFALAATLLGIAHGKNPGT